jgi:hypothetical protein
MLLKLSKSGNFAQQPRSRADLPRKSDAVKAAVGHRNHRRKSGVYEGFVYAMVMCQFFELTGKILALKEFEIKKYKVVVWVFVLVFGMMLIGCPQPTNSVSPLTYLVRSGGQSTGSGYYEKGVFISPNGALIPYLIEDARDTGNFSEVEELLYQLGFTQNWVQSVKNNLNTNGSAFVFYTNTSSYYRWLWITEN